MMAEPCTSSGKISAIDERTKGHDRAIEGFKVALEATNQVLLKISEALADIRHLHEDQNRNERDINELFDRVRGLELAPGQTMSKVGYIVLTAGSGCAGGIVSALVIWLVKGS